jgi:hypothetical protein
LDGPEAPEALHYPLPSSSPVVRWLIDNLEVPDTSRWDGPTEGWSVRTQSYHHRFSGWMARAGHLATLVAALLPEWQARWRRCFSHWSGLLSLLIGDESFTLRFAGSELQLLDQPVAGSEAVHLTPQAFVQLVFGYRTIAQATEQSISTDSLVVLDVLFPAHEAWIPSSDWF